MSAEVGDKDTGVRCKAIDCLGTIIRTTEGLLGESPIITGRCGVCGTNYSFQENRVPQYVEEEETPPMG